MLVDSLASFADTGMDLWTILDQLLDTSTYKELLACVLNIWEQGCQVTVASINKAAALCIANGNYL
jgi:hypothetical protein